MNMGCCSSAYIFLSDILTCVYDHAVIYSLLFHKLRSLVHISAVFVPVLCELNFVGCKLLLLLLADEQKYEYSGMA